jgi:hypothetical protein
MFRCLTEFPERIPGCDRSLPLHVNYPYDAFLASGPYAVIRHDAASDSCDLDGQVLGSSHRRGLLNLFADRVADRSARAEVWAGGDTMPRPPTPPSCPASPTGPDPPPPAVCRSRGRAVNV